ncbi:hypothetical protein [Myroides odoratus]|uniref:Uncharacterized protein n=1 Tax=Myroides odoratus TaxID=256 RepID=A0A378RNG4_MYROD|nr:hypothetical protein [Myroides odoratus]QQU04022.1 hypothetical protein I6I89_01630 [Myroides odoratus]STZ28592.1 Uncharacterised protein [Myroides odoratus]
MREINILLAVKIILYLLDLLPSVIIGVLGGLASSWMFLKMYLSKKVPKVQISEYICCEKDEAGKNIYWFKFINTTKYPLMDVTFEPVIYQPQPDKSGSNLKRIPIPVKRNNIVHIPAECKKDGHNLHCMRISTDFDIDKEWQDDNCFINVTITARHTYSGYTKVVSKTFDNKKAITKLKFQSGNNLDVK